jgi:hypothetical protein
VFTVSNLRLYQDKIINTMRVMQNPAGYAIREFSY